MITRETIDGREVVVAYLRPAADGHSFDSVEPSAATLIKVMWPDGGVSFMVPEPDDHAQFYSEDQPRVPAGEPGGGEWGSVGVSTAHMSEKALRAKANAKLNDETIQRWSEANEREVAALIHASATTSHLNDPLDVRATLGGVRHGFEVKSLYTNTNDKVTVRGAALAAKLQAGHDENRRLHTIVVDERRTYKGAGAVPHLYSGHRLYYHAGVGSFRVGSMTRIRDAAHLRTLMRAK